MSAAEQTRIDASLSIRDHELFIEDASARALAERFGTPLYVVSAATLRGNVERFTTAWSAAWREGPFQLLPALKGQNKYPAVAALYRSEDFVEGPLAFSQKRAPNWKGR